MQNQDPNLRLLSAPQQLRLPGSCRTLPRQAGPTLSDGGFMSQDIFSHLLNGGKGEENTHIIMGRASLIGGLMAAP